MGVAKLHGMAEKVLFNIKYGLGGNLFRVRKTQRKKRRPALTTIPAVFQPRTPYHVRRFLARKHSETVPEDMPERKRGCRSGRDRRRYCALSVLRRRKPRLLFLLSGVLLLRLAARTFLWLLFQLPPRFTRLEPPPHGHVFRNHHCTGMVGQKYRRWPTMLVRLDCMVRSSIRPERHCSNRSESRRRLLRLFSGRIRIRPRWMRIPR